MRYIVLSIIALYLYIENNNLLIAQSKDSINWQMDAEKIELSTELIDEIYCDDQFHGDRYNIILKLRFKYKNTSNADAILYKGNEVSFANILISLNEDDANEKKYITTTEACSILPSAKFAIKDRPGKDFVILKAGQVFTKEREVGVIMEKGEPNGDITYLKAGEYVFQIATSTWPGTDEQENILKQKWETIGFLYTFNVKSLPMKFSIVKNPPLIKCTEYNQ